MKGALPISVIFIVKNEEFFLEAAIKSVVDFAAEVIVVDTGSSDRTREIAQLCGAQVHVFPWTHDFSAARNDAARLANQEWIFFLDGDECFAEAQVHELAEVLAKPNLAALGVLQRNYSTGGFASGWKSGLLPEVFSKKWPMLQAHGYVDNLMYKIYRRGLGIEWRGRVHETIIPSCDEKRLVYQESRLIVHHFGLLKEQAFVAAKKDYYAELAWKKVEENPQHQNPWFEWGISLMNLKRWAEAEGAFARALSLRPDWQEAQLFRARALLHLERFADAEALLRALLETSYHFEDVVTHLSTALLYQGKFDEVLKLIAICESLEVEHPHFHINAATLLFELKDWERCRQHLKCAERLNPGDSFVHEALQRLDRVSASDRSFSS